ncbi:MAG: PQQ-binding-like beta-propeller repeat protein [Bryobacteraceae bacterium]|nr:PQQ-binding-like beta-propeller repeat protein [Bryobacteraceae bacterium]MDW8377464.1 PQQ-binding-like beta-propeller repeat protein [Bryobacterales bacterium]
MAILVLPAALRADNWPQWRGPTLDGVSAERNLPVRWSRTENVTWSLPMPDRSGSTPIIWGERIFLNVADGDKLELWCVNREKGEILWKRPLGGGNYKINKQNMSSPSPVTDGKTVWVMTGTGIVKAFDFSGKELWARDIQKDYGQFGLNWGYGSSPLLHNGSLYIPVLHGMKTDDPSYVLRLDGKTGKTLARQERPTKAQVEAPDAYTTPMLAKVGNRFEVIVSGGDLVTGHDPETLAELWRADVLNPTNYAMNRIIASPVVKDGIIYASSRVKPFVALKPGGQGDVSKSHLLWTYANGPDVPTPVTDGQLLFIANDRGILFCLDAKTGAEIWAGQRISKAIYSASPVLADGKVYITSEEGTTTVIKAARHFEVLAENKLDEYTLSSPAISDGQIFLRTEKALYCIGKRVRQ